MKTQQTNYFLITFSFVVGIFLTITPLPEWAIWARPQFIFAILLFWVITSPAQFGIGLAWIVGVVMDLMTGTPLGEHSIIFVLLIYIVLKSRTGLTHSPVLQQITAIFVLASVNALFQGLILGFTGHSTHIAFSLLSAVTTALIWPWLFALLDRLRPMAVIF